MKGLRARHSADGHGAGTQGREHAPEVGRDKRPYLVLRLVVSNGRGAAGLAIILVLVLLAAFASSISHYDPTQYRVGAFLSPPDKTHLFGTDALGRDVFSRTIHGTRYTLWIGIISVSISLVLGVFLGMLGGYFGGLTDEMIMRVMDVLLSLPQLVLALAVATVLGPSLPNLMVAVGISAVPGYARLTRSTVLSAREQQYVEAAKAVGCADGAIMFRHILPNVVAPLVVLSTLGLASRILSAAALSFLGLGAQPPTPEWGLMLSEGRRYLTVAWWVTVFPGLFIVSSVLAINMIGDSLRDALDPRLRSMYRSASY